MSKSKNESSKVMVLVLVVIILFFVWSAFKQPNENGSLPDPKKTPGKNSGTPSPGNSSAGGSQSSSAGGSSSSSGTSPKYGFSMNGPISAWKWLSKGDRSREVMYVQMAINRVKRLKKQPTISTDGYFGSITEAAVDDLMGRKATKYSLVKQRVIQVYKASGRSNPYTSGLNFSGASW